jgi:hypothetical protein
MRRFILIAFILGTFTTIAQAGQYRGTAEQRAACTPDVLMYCQSAIPDPGRIVACLKKQPRLSAPCQLVFAK